MLAAGRRRYRGRTEQHGAQHQEDRGRNPADHVRPLFRRHQLRGRRRTLCRDGQEPLVRIPAEPDGLGGVRRRRGPHRRGSLRAQSALRPPHRPRPRPQAHRPAERRLLRNVGGAGQDLRLLGVGARRGCRQQDSRRNSGPSIGRRIAGAGLAGHHRVRHMDAPRSPALAPTHLHTGQAAHLPGIVAGR